MVNDQGSATEPHISAVIATYQREGSIGRAIRSALDQHYPPVEVIVIDDGSTDGTAGRVASMRGPVRYYRQHNQGVSAARNRGVDLASGEWVAFLDSDDAWRPEHLSSLAAAIRATRGAAEYYFADASVTSDGDAASWFGFCGFEPSSPFEVIEMGFELAMRPYQPMMIQGTVVRRSTWQEVGGLREDLPTREDTHIYFVLGLRGSACASSNIGVDLIGNVGDNLRLTHQHGTGTAVYGRATVTLYRDILGRPDLPDKHSGELKRRLADGWWVLAKAQLEQGQALGALNSAWHSATTHPRSIAARIRRAVQRVAGSE